MPFFRTEDAKRAKIEGVGSGSRRDPQHRRGASWQDLDRANCERSGRRVHVHHSNRAVKPRMPVTEAYTSPRSACPGLGGRIDTEIATELQQRHELQQTIVRTITAGWRRRLPELLNEIPRDHISRSERGGGIHGAVATRAMLIVHGRPVNLKLTGVAANTEIVEEAEVAICPLDLPVIGGETRWCPGRSSCQCATRRHSRPRCSCPRALVRPRKLCSCS